MIVEKANAKINLALKVLKKREDGYHDLDMIMQEINLYDKLDFTFINSDEVLITGMDDIEKENNLIYKAVMLIKNTYNINNGVKIDVQKNIPTGAGLGGGSSNAACVLKTLNREWKLNLSIEDLISLGIKIGSDVPFFIIGKTARVRGKGEKVEEVDISYRSKIILITLKFKCPTPIVFQYFDQLNISNNKSIDKLLKYKNRDFIKNCFNDLDKPANCLPYVGGNKIKNIENYLLKNSAINCFVSGSGSSIIAFFDKDIDDELIKQLKKQFTYIDEICHIFQN